MITPELLKGIAPSITDKSVETFLPYLNKYLNEYEVTTPLRISAFLAQVLHESGCFRYVRELADGSAYEGRKDLGNDHPGDGKRYKGRGLIQLTGRFNYAAISKDFFNDPDVLLRNPDLLATPDNATRAAFWFWKKKNLNALADNGDFIGITKKINGGTNGLAERQLYYAKAKELLATA